MKAIFLTKRQRLKILQRDNFICQSCESYCAGLHIHHKDRNPLNNNFDNLITLCASCHIKRHHKEDMDKLKQWMKLKLQVVGEIPIEPKYNIILPKC